MAVVRRNPNKNRNVKPQGPPVRRVKRSSDGAIKDMEAIFAAKMVARGTHVYIDGGPDDSKNLPPKGQSFVDKMKAPSEIIPLAKVTKIDITGEGDMYTGPQRTIRADSTEDLNTSVPSIAPSPTRKVRKKSDVPKEKLDYIMKTNTANPVRAETTRSAGDLKSIIDKVRSDRKK